MASGTPVIGFKTQQGKTLTAVEEIIDDGITGIICKNFSEDALVEALDRARSICEDKDYTQMRAACKKTVETRFQWETFITKVIALSRQEKSQKREKINELLV